MFFFQGRAPENTSWLVLWIEGVVVSCGVRCFPTVECTDIHGWCWDGRWIRWLWWLGAVLVVVAIFWVVYHRHCCQDVKWIGRQVQIIQAQWNDRELPYESVWHCGLIWIVVDGQNLGFWGCDRGNWGHFRCMTLWQFSRIKDVQGVVSMWTGLVGDLFHKEHIRIHGIDRNIRGHVKLCKEKKIVSWLSNWVGKVKKKEWSVLRVMIIHFPEAGFPLTFPLRCSASVKIGSRKWNLSWLDVNISQKWSL